ncbi:MAG: Dam family site-specific DNA-(adenine-N6)-methyltransferase [Chloroflexota bacterium]|nr:Dam family site-specific DNA-(adenine-N6)-methyltransferase [Chloroflexota bacterium]
MAFLNGFLPKPSQLTGRYVEPFVGSAAVFLHVRPRKATISDANPELIDLYLGIKKCPAEVWRAYSAFKNTKREYLRVRRMDPAALELVDRAARLLYLNRTCFKGNWRHNLKGEFNVGYGGQSRRWVLSEDYLTGVSNALRRAVIECGDFEDVIDRAEPGDFLFLDPPYRPGERELVHSHYLARRFGFDDHRRLAAALKRADSRGVEWCLTTSGHLDIRRMFVGHQIREIPTRGNPRTPSGEVLVLSKRGRR